MRATVRFRSQGVMEETQETISHFTCIHTDSWGKGAGGIAFTPKADDVQTLPDISLQTQENRTFVGRAVFITHTVGLCLPVWSLMLGEGLCPAANEYAAPSTDDCGGGGGGGGSASCKRNNRKIISAKDQISRYLATNSSPPSRNEASKQKQGTRDVKAQVEKPVADQQKDRLQSGIFPPVCQ